jgi:regulator of protease activity HflC (stomatin/prohibitin superfamily)
MWSLWIALIGLVLFALALLAVKVVKQYEQGVLFRLGKVIAVRKAGLTVIIPFVDVLNRVSLRIVTMPIQSQGIITRDNVSVDVSAVAYYRIVDAEKSVVAIENVGAAINQIAQTTLRKVVGQHTLDETLSETDRINIDIKTILDVATEDWGVQVRLVELGVDKNRTVVFPVPLMSTIGAPGRFLARVNAAAATTPPMVPINGIPLTTTTS